MKKAILILVVLAAVSNGVHFLVRALPRPVSPNIQIETHLADDSVVTVSNEVFTVLYSIRKEQPLVLSYQVQCPTKGVSRKGKDFYENDSIHTSDDHDYYKNVWDKGHLAPSASFDCSHELQDMTFSYLNCALQHQSLNRGVWAKLEGLERKWAEQDSIYVNIQCVFTDSSLVLTTGATVPDAFFKQVIKGQDTLKYYFPNQEVLIKDLSYYQVN